MTDGHCLLFFVSHLFDRTYDTVAKYSKDSKLLLNWLLRLSYNCSFIFNNGNRIINFAYWIIYKTI